VAILDFPRSRASRSSLEEAEEVLLRLDNALSSLHNCVTDGDVTAFPNTTYNKPQVCLHTSIISESLRLQEMEVRKIVQPDILFELSPLVMPTYSVGVPLGSPVFENLLKGLGQRECNP
jgi:hypothetical protein